MTSVSLDGLPDDQIEGLHRAGFVLDDKWGVEAHDEVAGGARSCGVLTPSPPQPMKEKAP